MRHILVISHGHPELSKGGAEMASYALFQSLKAAGHRATYLARTSLPTHPNSFFSHWNGEDELLLHTGMQDFFLFQNQSKHETWRAFRTLLETLKPDVVHVHHYVHLGVEMLQIIRDTLPGVRLILTLHEYLAICHHQGQMIRNDHKKSLCYASSPMKCHQCFPNISASDFFLRAQYLRRHLYLADQFIAPSHFLRQRYTDWGLDEDRITVIENIPSEHAPLQPREASETDTRGRFAYFGQLNPYKGIDVLLRALAAIPRKQRKALDIHLSIHGANLEGQPDAFQQEVAALLKACGSAVTMHGPYHPEEQRDLLAGCDWVILPSIWWENSPMVIHEALRAGRPIIASDLGGMREKIPDESGLFFKARQHLDLCRAMLTAAEPMIWRTHYESLLTAQPETPTEILTKHLHAYDNPGVKDATAYHELDQRQ